MPLDDTLSFLTNLDAVSTDPAVALGIYARVLQALRLEAGLAAIAADDVIGRKLQDAKLEPKARAPRRSNKVAPKIGDMS